MFRFAIMLSVLVLTALPAHAQSEDPILSLPDGQVILNISATERVEVEQDLLVATLSYVATNRDARALQDEINTAMKKAIDLVKKEDSVKVQTGSYQVYETTIDRTREKQWRGSQTLTIKSTDSDTVLELAGNLQDMKLTMNGLSYMLSPDRAADIQDNLMEAALDRLQRRADRAAKALNKSSAELREVNTQGESIPYMPKVYARGAMMEMASDSMAAPVAEAGEETITLTVAARAILKP